MLSSDRKAGHGAVGSFLDESNKQGKISAESTNVVEGHSRTTNGLDQAALLRRVAKYIEEDATAADKLAAVMSPKDRVRLETTLNSMEYTVRQPNSRELRGVALISTVPFIGFGFMDNAIMVVAGEYIDLTVGIALGISTMAAAALGNTISDVAGVGLGGAIESLATRLGLPTPGLSRAQMRLRKTRIATIIGNAIGVAIGCLLGMFPLVFMSDPDAVEAVKRREKIVGLIDAVVEEASSFLSASSATLFILERETGVLWAHRRDSSGTSNTNIQDLKLHVSDSGPVSRAARSREAVNVAAGGRGGAEGVTSSALCMPVFAADGEVAGVVQVLGKRKHGTMHQLGFSADDAKKLSVLCSHISVALENIKRSDEADEVHLREVIALMRSYGGTDEDRPFLEHLSESTATPT